MEAYIDENREKGLFTFYLEQAELEDQIKNAKKERQKENQRRRQEKNQKKNMSMMGGSGQYGQQQNEGDKTAPLQKVATNEQINGMKEGKDHKNEEQNRQHRKKLIEILNRQRYKNSKMHNLKIILQEEEPSNAELREQLTSLFGEVDINFRKENKNIKGKDKGEQNGNQHNPFQRLALCPTNFDTSFEDGHKGKKATQQLKSKSVENTLMEYKKMQKVEKIASSNNYTQQDKNIKQILQKHFLPKLQLKPNSQLTELPTIPRSQRSRLKASRSKKQLINQSNPQIPTERHSCKLDPDLLVENALKSGSYRKIRSRKMENKIYPIFIEHPSAHRYEEEQRYNKEKMYADIIKQLKFK